MAKNETTVTVPGELIGAVFGAVTSGLVGFVPADQLREALRDLVNDDESWAKMAELRAAMRGETAPALKLHKP